MIYANKCGHRVETDDAEADPVKFWPQGEAPRVYSMDYTLFHASFLPATEPGGQLSTPAPALRAQFEAAMQRDYLLFPLALAGGGEYISTGTQDMWKGFQLAHKEAQ